MKRLLLALACGTTVAAAAPDVEWRLYLASIAAANGGLRTHETSVTRRWLDEAPVTHRGWEWRYLDRLADLSLRSQAAHAGAITSLAVSADGQWLATSSLDKTVKVWDARSGAPAATLEGHGATTWTPAFRPGTTELATFGSDGTVRVWSWREAREIRRFERVGNGMGALAWSPDGALLAAASWTFVKDRGVVGWIHVWEAATGAVRLETEYGVKPITTIAFRPDGQQVVVGTWDGWIGAFAPTGDGRPAFEITLPMDDSYPALQGVAFSPDGALFAATAKDGLARVYHSADGRLARTLTGHARWANAAAFGITGAWVATASSDETIRLWDARTGRPLRVLHGHTASVNAIAVTPDGTRMISGAADGTLRWWDAALADISATTWRHDAGNVYGIDMAPSGSRIVTAGWGGRLTMWDGDTGRQVWQKPVHETSANAVAFSPDGTRLVSGGNDGRLQVTSAATGEVVATWEHVTDGRAAGIAWSRDGRYVVAPSSRPHGKLWNAATGTVHHTITGTKGEIYDVAFSPDSRRVAVAWTSGDIRVVDVATGADAFALSGHEGAVYAVAWHPDGSLVATGGADRMIRVWDASTGRLLRTMSGHTELVYSLDFSPDGQRLVSASTDQTVRLWVPASGDATLTLPFASQVYGAQFTRDGRRLAVLPMDDTVVMLDGSSKR